MIRADAEDHAKKWFGWWVFFLPLVLLYMAILAVGEMAGRLWSGHCLRCPHHASVHRGSCRFFFQGYARGKMDPTQEEITRWHEAALVHEGARVWEVGGSRPCRCLLFIGNPWGRAEIDPHFGK